MVGITLQKNHTKFFLCVIIFINLFLLGKSEIYNNASRILEIIDNNDLHSSKRNSRFLTFQTLADDIRIGIEFTVPFLTVPVKRSQDAAFNFSKGLANINVAAIMLAAAVVFAVVLFAGFLTSFMPVGSIPFYDFKRSRMDPSYLLESLKFNYPNADGSKSVSSIISLMEDVKNSLQEDGSDLNTCVQKAVCSIVQQSSSNVYKRKGSSFQKIVDGLTSSSWVLTYVKGTAIEDAIKRGKEFTCSYKYNQCKWNDAKLHSYLEIFN